MASRCISIFVMLLVSACVPLGERPLSSTAAATAALSTPTSQAAAPTVELAPTLPVGSTAVPSALILADFPLAKGAAWKYAAEISYQPPGTPTAVEKWSGWVIDRVIHQEEGPNGDMVFTLQEELSPTPPSGVWRGQGGTFEYTLAGDGIFEGSAKIYQWPLSDGSSWHTPVGSTYSMGAEHVGEVDTPYGKLKDCYNLVGVTNPDSAIDTFCPGVGFVEHFYTHHGTVQDEHFVLAEYTPGR